MTLLEFLEERIADDQAAADTADLSDHSAETASRPRRFTSRSRAYSPERIVLECLSKRALIKEIKRYEAERTGHAEYDLVVPALAAMAIPYEDHLDYDESWRV